jgi:signal recognition particle subunit SRP54
MFNALTQRFQDIFSGIAGKRRLSEDNISDAIREVRLALLEADVNYGVVKSFIKMVKEEALGDNVIKSVQPGQQFIKVVHDKLSDLMGSEEAPLDLTGTPAVIMLCGLQGSGKTTQCVKLASFLKGKQHKRTPLIAACDLRRPAAIKQLQVLGESADIPIFTESDNKDPVAVARHALKKAQQEGYDTLILDTAGRLHIDEDLMGELAAIKKATTPHEVLFVVNATMGQDAVKTAAEFDGKISITGTILTMLDSETRGGAALSIKDITKKPLKFEGVGEKVSDFQLFNPSSMADRILGMGDTINLVKKAQEHIDEEDAKKMEEKIRKATFTFEDYLSGMQTMKKMGPLSSLLKMIPGISSMPNLDMSDKEFQKMEAMILSMTQQERREECDITANRRKRIARGSGTKLEDVNKLVKSFKQVKKLFKGMPNMKKLEKMIGGLPCH